METVYQGVLIGVIATIGQDIWEAIVKHIFRFPTAGLALIGRWLGHMPRGVFVHHSISESAAIPNELLIGWVAHYVTGIVYGVMYLSFVQILLSSDPTITSALIFGLVYYIITTFILKVDIHFIHNWGIEFVLNVIIMFAVSHFYPRKNFGIRTAAINMEMVPWKYAKHLSVVLVVITLLIYILLGRR